MQESEGEGPVCAKVEMWLRMCMKYNQCDTDMGFNYISKGALFMVIMGSCSCKPISMPTRVCGPRLALSSTTAAAGRVGVWDSLFL